MNTYSPQTNDYVKWNNGKGVEGWIYFTDRDYITIETQVWPKRPEDQPYGTFHRNERTLVICFPESYHQLEYVKSRHCIDNEEEYVKKEFMYGEK